ncbi:hypothetical protein VTL71DRAFT_8325 [Oculimacula yallundae]|uniref:Uncharacterized protein n=1 Tax=Oculimacula yallundae TaxID=86028 RepID=A0ABR4CXF9_9HELO
MKSFESWGSVCHASRAAQCGVSGVWNSAAPRPYQGCLATEKIMLLVRVKEERRRWIVEGWGKKGNDLTIGSHWYSSSQRARAGSWFGVCLGVFVASRVQSSQSTGGLEWDDARRVAFQDSSCLEYTFSTFKRFSKLIYLYNKMAKASILTTSAYEFLSGGKIGPFSPDRERGFSLSRFGMAGF